MNIVMFLIDITFNFVLWILILRFWMQLVRADYYNPLSQFVVKVSNPMVVPVRRIVPGLGGLDLATLLLVFVIAIGKFLLLNAFGAGIAMGDVLLLGTLFAVKKAGTLLFFIMIVMALMSWVVQGPHPMHALFHQLCDPFLKPIRNILPPIGGLDLSVLVAFIILNVLNMLIGNLIPIWNYPILS